MRKSNSTIEFSSDISPRLTWIIFFIITAYSVGFLFPVVGLYFHGDTFGLFNAPTLGSFRDIPEVFAYASQWASRFMQNGIFYSVGEGLYGHIPWKWHLQSLMLFVVDSLMLFGILKILLKDNLASLVGILIFSLTGAFFYSQAWISGSVELLATFFAFGATLVHVWVTDENSGCKYPILFELLALALLLLAYLSKETMLPIFMIWIVLDLIRKKRLTAGGIGAIPIALTGLYLANLRFQYLSQAEDYSISASPGSILANFFVYFFDPIISTGGEFYLMQLVGRTGGSQGAIGDVMVWVKSNLAFAGIFGLVILAMVLFWISLTISPRWLPWLKGNGEKSLIPRCWGWLFWLLLLIPAIMTPGHHYPYYVMAPLAFLMLTIGPAIASGLRKPGFKKIILIGLALYIIWYPINTHLAFKFSNLTIGMSRVKVLVESVGEIYPDRPDGLHIIVDGSDHILAAAAHYGHAVNFNYPGVLTFMIDDYHRLNDEHPDGEFAMNENTFVTRNVDGEWVDVTVEFENYMNNE